MRITATTSPLNNRQHIDYMQLPIEFLNEMKCLLNDDYDDFLASYSSPAQKAFRINTIKPCDFDLTVYGKKRVPYTSNCYYLEEDSLGSSVFHHLGAVYIQEPSAMIPALVLNPPKGAKVLDMCASPGGKTGQLAEIIGEDGLLVSNEINLSRCKTLLGNVERLGAKNTVVTNLPPKEIAKSLQGWFDAVLVDAPCSGEGMFRKNPDAINEWSLEQSQSCAIRQQDIILTSAKCVKTGGLLVYSTCTFSKRENEDIIDFLIKNGEFELVAIPDVFPISQGFDSHRLTGRLYPHKMSGEGHFVACLKRVEPIQIKTQKSLIRTLNKKEEQIAKPFLDCLDHPTPMILNNNLIFPPKIIPPLSYGIIGCGVKVGDIQDRVIPHHQVFSAYGKNFYNKISLDYNDKRVRQYLVGEEINTTNSNGWCSIIVNGCSLGGAKISGGNAKNHYPKGLRIKPQ